MPRLGMMNARPSDCATRLDDVLGKHLTLLTVARAARNLLGHKDRLLDRGCRALAWFSRKMNIVLQINSATACQVQMDIANIGGVRDHFRACPTVWAQGDASSAT